MEEVLPPGTGSSARFEPTRVRQVTVFLDNRVGRLQTLIRTYEQAGGRILSLSIQNATDVALVRLICSDVELARRTFTDEGFAFAEQDLLIIKLPDRPHPLQTICATLLSAEISIHYAYPLMTGKGTPAIVLYVDDLILASQLMIRKGLTIIGESDLAGELPD
jgi:hypothetical protein